MEMVYLNGKMGENIVGNIFKAKNKVMGDINIQMEKYIKDNGKMENNMEKELCIFQMDILKQICGKMGKKLIDNIIF